MTTAVDPQTTFGTELATWSQNIVWGTNIVRGTDLIAINQQAWAQNIVSGYRR